MGPWYLQVVHSQTPPPALQILKFNVWGSFKVSRSDCCCAEARCVCPWLLWASELIKRPPKCYFWFLERNKKKGILTQRGGHPGKPQMALVAFRGFRWGQIWLNMGPRK